ncbi:MAG: EAL and HDOD domain-containing protein [Candidatus Sericytochromatia bacterium]
MAEVYIGRQPIFDRDLQLFGYELLYRSAQMDTAVFSDANHATSVVMSNTFLEIGLERLIGDKLAFLNLTRAFFMGEYPIPQRQDRLVLEVLEDITIDDELVEAVQGLANNGFKLALDDVVNPEDVKRLLGIAHIVKVDLMLTDRSVLAEHVKVYKQHGIKLLAEKVETKEELEWCKLLGFDYFQGYFLCKPSIVREKKLSGTKMTIIQLLGQMQKPDVEFSQIEEVIRQDVSLSYKLLRLLNSAFYSTRSEIKSIRQALTLLGLSEIRSWVSLLLLSEAENKPPELIKTAIIRGKMCELLASELKMARNEAHFIVGLFSVLDALMDIPLEEILAQVPLSKDVIDALLRREGELGKLIDWVLAYEAGEWDRLSDYPLGADSILGCYLDAVSWADEMTSYTQPMAA